MKFSQVIVSAVAIVGLAQAQSANATSATTSNAAAVNMPNNIKNVGVAAGVAAVIGYLM